MLNSSPPMLIFFCHSKVLEKHVPPVWSVHAPAAVHPQSHSDSEREDLQSREHAACTGESELHSLCEQYTPLDLNLRLLLKCLKSCQKHIRKKNKEKNVTLVWSYISCFYQIFIQISLLNPSLSSCFLPAEAPTARRSSHGNLWHPCTSSK